MEKNEHIQNQINQSNASLKKSHQDGNENNDGHIDENIGNEKASWKTHMDLLSALFILVVMLVLRYGFGFVPTKWIDFTIHFAAFILAGWRVSFTHYNLCSINDRFSFLCKSIFSQESKDSYSR